MFKLLVTRIYLALSYFYYNVSYLMLYFIDSSIVTRITLVIDVALTL